jgi:hypothetical protein
MTQRATFPSVVPESVRRLIQLFEDRAEELRFPGVDFARLTGGVAAIEAQLGELEALQASLAKAQEAVALCQKDLIGIARQAHAYATIYAQNDPDLSAELMTIAVGEPERATRRPKQKSEETPFPREAQMRDTVPERSQVTRRRAEPTVAAVRTADPAEEAARALGESDPVAESGPVAESEAAE